MRGDRPTTSPPMAPAPAFTPHARGSTAARRVQGVLDVVYPACAGIDLFIAAFSAAPKSLPRMRGDRPLRERLLELGLKFTPHARGSTPEPVFFGDGKAVYPACAGIDPFHLPSAAQPLGLPRMRGDRPSRATTSSRTVPFTPHARGSTQVF